MESMFGTGTMACRRNQGRLAGGAPLGTDFYLRDTLLVAEDLLGCLLVRRHRSGLRSGRIVETEAYLTGDVANHATRGMTKRNAAMFLGPGTIYVYRLHRSHCLNLVTGPAGVAEAVLIRAVEPIEGIELMKRRRGKDEMRELTTGPGKLCAAFDIDVALNGASSTGGESPVMVLPRGGERPETIATGRIGVHAAKEKRWRFCVVDSPFLSKKPKIV